VAQHAPTTVVVADDSALMRTVLTASLRQAGIEVVAVAADGDEALVRCEELAPDVLSLDLAMPGRDGVSVLREMRARGVGIPVVVVSAFSAAAGATAVDALAEGAFDLVAKPTSREEIDGFASALVDRIRLAASERRRRAAIVPRGRLGRRSRSGRRLSGATAADAGRIVVIACSTGGPRALGELLPSLPERLGGGTLIVQHMPEGFTASLAERLDHVSQLAVSEAVERDRPDPRRVLLAPGGRHMRVTADGAIALTEEPAIGGLRPRADLTIKDAVAVWGDRVLLVVLTGMGRDALEGAAAVHDSGGHVLVEAASSCVVHGMPRAIVEAGLADEELDLGSLAGAILAEAA